MPSSATTRAVVAVPDPRRRPEEARALPDRVLDDVLRRARSARAGRRGRASSSSGCVQVWLPTTMPAARSSRTMPGDSLTLRPIRKNVARACSDCSSARIVAACTGRARRRRSARRGPCGRAARCAGRSSPCSSQKGPSPLDARSAARRARQGARRAEARRRAVWAPGVAPVPSGRLSDGRLAVARRVAATQAARRSRRRSAPPRGRRCRPARVGAHPAPSGVVRAAAGARARAAWRARSPRRS